MNGTKCNPILSGREVVERWKTHDLRVNGAGPWRAQCGAHDDRSPSVSIREVGGAVKVHCFAGCDRDDVLAAVGLTWRDVTPLRPGGASTRTHQRPKVVPVKPKPKAELDRVLDAFHAAGMTWRTGEPLGVWRCECPACGDPRLSVWVVDPGARDEDREGEPVQLWCANGCNPRVVAYLLRRWGRTA